MFVKQGLANVVKIREDRASQHFLPLEIDIDTQSITIIPTYLPHKGSRRYGRGAVTQLLAQLLEYNKTIRYSTRVAPRTSSNKRRWRPWPINADGRRP